MCKKPFFILNVLRQDVLVSFIPFRAIIIIIITNAHSYEYMYMHMYISFISNNTSHHNVKQRMTNIRSGLPGSTNNDN